VTVNEMITGEAPPVLIAFWFALSKPRHLHTQTHSGTAPTRSHWQKCSGDKTNAQQ